MSTILAQDLRGAAKDQHRFKEHTVKWSREGHIRAAPGIRCKHDPGSWSLACNDCAKRPVRRESSRYTQAKHQWNRTIRDQSAMARKVFRNDVLEATDAPVNGVNDSWTGDQVGCGYDEGVEPSAVEIMYSFDAQSGPTGGHSLLSNAITQAVDRFENKQTEKLAKEYDFVDDSKEFSDESAAEVDENDFEFVDLASLH